MAFVDAHFGFLPALISRLEMQITLFEAHEIFSDAEAKLRTVPESVGVSTSVQAKLSSLVGNNVGLKKIRAITAIQGETTVSLGDSQFTPQEIAVFKFARVVTCAVERSFSQYTAFLRDNRHALQVENLTAHLVVMCNSDK